MNTHETQWKQLQTASINQRIPQAMLFVGPLHCALADFVSKVMQLLFCKKGSNEPCFSCIDCDLAGRGEHPDMEWVRPEKSGGAIKIDQVRQLHQSAYLTPQRSAHRVIVIEAADRMNSASANALLKILEEPAQHTVFILIAQQLSSVLPTVLSRCQIIPFYSVDDSHANNLLTLGESYPQESPRALIIAQSEVILDHLIAVIEGREHPCVLVPQWSQFELDNILWFLYLVYSQLQIMHRSTIPVTGPAVNQLVKLASLLNPVLVFNQLDKINNLLRKLNHNMNVNQTLALEDLLLGVYGI